MTSTLSDTQMLFIRACKVYSHQAPQRLRSVYRRFYLSSPDLNYDDHITNILFDIIDEYNLVKPSRLALQLAPENRIYYGESDNYQTTLLNVARSIIAMAPIDKFGGNYRKPARFRK